MLPKISSPVRTTAKAIGNLLLKLEGTQPSGSIKYRLAYHILSTALESGKLQKGQSIVEVSNGNTGIALAYLAKSIGSKAKIILPDTAQDSVAKRIAELGSEPIILPYSKGLDYAFATARKLEANGTYWPDQFHNKFPQAYSQLADELLCLDAEFIVVPVGTGGTLSGIAGKIKNRIQLIAVETTTKDPIEGLRHEETRYENDSYAHSAASKVVRVTKQEAGNCLEELANHGIRGSLSTGAGVFAARKLGTTTAVICPDAGCENG